MSVIKSEMREETKANTATREKTWRESDYLKGEIKKNRTTMEENAKEIAKIKERFTAMSRKEANKNSYRSKLEAAVNDGDRTHTENAEVEEDIV